MERKERSHCPREQYFITNVLLEITGFKGKAEHLYKQTGTLQTVIRVLIKYSDIAKEAIVRKEQPEITKKIDRT